MSSAWTGQSGSPTRLLLLRHGQTVLSIDRRYSGHGDPELTTVGRAQAGETLVLVTHVTPIKMILRQALGGSAEILYRLHLDLASLSIAEFYPDGQSSVRLVNQTGYL